MPVFVYGFGYNTYIIIKGEKYDWTKNKRLFKRYRSL